jgi:DNA-binding transcriptional LysR family regulator
VELRELRYFAVLCEELHFGRAAERLHISQSPLSQATAQLERKLGTRLLDRSSRHVRLTPAGAILVEHARRLLRDAEDAVGATRRAGSGETGSVRVAADAATRQAVLPALLLALEERFPALEVEVADAGGDRTVDAVLRGAADVGLMLSPPDSADIGAKVLRRDRPIAVVRRDHPLARKRSVTLASLAEHPLVLWRREDARDAVLAMFDGRRPRARRVADVESGAFWDAMRSGGYAVVAPSEPVSGDFVGLHIDDATAEFTTAMVWSRRSPPPLLPGLVDAADAAVAANGWH